MIRTLLLLPLVGLLAACGASGAVAPPTPTSSPVIPAPTILAVAPATASFAPPSPSAPARTPIPLPATLQLSVPAGSSTVWTVIADRLFRSLDRGDSWQERPVPPAATNPRISFVSDGEGWLLSRSSLVAPCPSQSIRIWHTADGAMTWTESPTAGIAEGGCKDEISFVTATTGFVTLARQEHAPTLYRTIDGGRSWVLTTMADPPGPGRTADVSYWNSPVHAFGSVWFVGLMREATLGETHFVYRSVDGGASWTYAAKLPYGSWPGFITASHWVQLAVPGQSQETTDGGATWHLSTSEYGQAGPVLPQVEFADAQVGYATQRGSIQRSVDGGTHWSGIRTPGTN